MTSSLTVRTSGTSNSFSQRGLGGSRKQAKFVGGVDGPNAERPSLGKRALSPETQAWVKKVMERAIDFIPDESFDLPEARQLLVPETIHPSIQHDMPEGTDLANRLLEKQEEAYLFRRMNYLKCLAGKLKRRLNPKKPDLAKLTKIEEWIDQATTVRNQLVRANMRLVISIAKKYVGPMVSFDEILSEAHFSLIQAVEKFNIGRGNKFSTYATRAIRNNLNHYVNRKRRRAQVCSSSDDSVLQAAPDHRWQTPRLEAQVEHARKAVASLIELLEPEKQAIIQARFGFVGDEKGQSLKTIGDGLGVSRERIRQIEGRALADLRKFAAAIQLEMPDEL